MVSQGVVFELEPERAQGIRGKASRVLETKATLSAHAPTVGKNFLGIFLGKRSLVVRRGRSRGHGTQGQGVCQTVLLAAIRSPVLFSEKWEGF